jgi:uncharacterized protein
VKDRHEIRDPIYGFIHVLNSERALIDSKPFQRLRQIHQLALTSLIYPGATHRRFEHSLGVMHLAGKVFDTVVENMRPDVEERLKPEMGENPKQWRLIVRAAALLHDIGHLPFSHAAEDLLLPEGVSHETLTVNLLREKELCSILTEMPFSANIDQVVKLAVGSKDAPKDLAFSDWETILAEIITGSAFGVDRLDYLMRDSFHAGVAYGSLDYLRLTDCLRILPFPEEGEDLDEAKLKLGVTHSGLYSAEALVMARHWMFSQVYFHRLRMLYDEYLCRYMVALFGERGYPASADEHLKWTDNEVFAQLRKAASNPSASGHKWAKRIAERDHHALIKSISTEKWVREEARIKEGVQKMKTEFGSDNILLIKRDKEAAVEDFPVEMHDGKVRNSVLLSKPLGEAPRAFALNLYAEKSLGKKATKFWNDIQ